MYHTHSYNTVRHNSVWISKLRTVMYYCNYSMSDVRKYCNKYNLCKSVNIQFVICNWIASVAFLLFICWWNYLFKIKCYENMRCVTAVTHTRYLAPFLFFPVEISMFILASLDWVHPSLPTVISAWLARLVFLILQPATSRNTTSTSHFSRISFFNDLHRLNYNWQGLCLQSNWLMDIFWNQSQTGRCTVRKWKH